MKKNKNEHKSDDLAALDRVKRLAVMAMFSDDGLELVLKGGNAMALIHKLTSRESVDLDFSMQHDFTDGLEMMKARISRALDRTFQPAGYMPFDVDMAKAPSHISSDMASFWGGYEVEFKLVTLEKYATHENNRDQMRREALSFGRGKKFLIDISPFEYVADKQETDLDGYRIYVSSTMMIACEKLRAICQQMEAYGPIVKRSERRRGGQRARDFFDIYTLVEGQGLDLTASKAIDMTREMFALKRVPLEFLGQIGEQREFHLQGFQSVQATVAPGVELQKFDFYFDYVVNLATRVLAAAVEAENVGKA